MDRFTTHQAILDCYKKTYTCLYEKVNKIIIKGIHIPIYLRQVPTLQLKKCFRKGFHIYATHLEEYKEKEP